MKPQQKNRDFSIDTLRCIGLFCIILAHVAPPNWLFQIRNFDVPLMVFISGYLYRGKQDNLSTITEQLAYLGKRFVRLVIPVWAFLTFFYLIQLYFPSLFTINYTLYPSIMLSSYLLMDGFGYVWIIRIFLLMALLGPLCMKFFKKPINLLYYYIGYELFYYLLKNKINSPSTNLFNEIVGYTAGFLVFFILGSLYNKFSRGQIKAIFAVSTIITIGAALYFIGYKNEPFNIGDYKYPPRLFYTQYAIAICFLLFYAKSYLGNFRSNLVAFIGSSSIWIYLWHIMFLFLIPKIHWGPRFILVFSLAMLISYLQQQLVNFLIRISGCSEAWSKQIRIIFCS